MRRKATGSGIIQTMVLAAFIALGAAAGMALTPARSSAGEPDRYRCKTLYECDAGEQKCCARGDFHDIYCSTACPIIVTG